MRPCSQRRQRHRAALALWGALLATRCQGSQSWSADFDPGESDQYVAVNGLQRRYKLFVPTSYDSDKPIPLWIMCPGTGDTPEKLIMQTGPQGMVPFAEKHNFAFSALEGDALSMNVEAHSQSLPWRPDDILYTMAVLRDVRKKVHVDMDRIRCVGFSRGARFCSRLASELSTFMSAIAPVSGIRFPLPNNSTRPMPIIAFHGKDDMVNPFWGNGDVYWTASVPNAIHKWARFNLCKRFERTDINERVTVFKHTHCKAGADVFLVQVKGAGHTWPGSNAPTGLGEISHDINANVDIFNFFKDHPKPRQRCHTALPGSKCHHHVTWAKTHGVQQEPHWYGGLNENSTVEEFQAFLREEIMEDCPEPCKPTTTTTTTSTSTWTSTTISSTTITRTTTTTTTVTTTTTTTTPWIFYQWVNELTHLQIKSNDGRRPVPGAFGTLLVSSSAVAAATAAIVAVSFLAILWKVRTIQTRRKSPMRKDTLRAAHPWRPVHRGYLCLDHGESQHQLHEPMQELYFAQTSNDVDART